MLYAVTGTQNISLGWIFQNPSFSKVLIKLCLWHDNLFHLRLCLAPKTVWENRQFPTQTARIHNPNLSHPPTARPPLSAIGRLSIQFFMQLICSQTINKHTQFNTFPEPFELRKFVAQRKKKSIKLVTLRVSQTCLFPLNHHSPYLAHCNETITKRNGGKVSIVTWMAPTPHQTVESNEAIIVRNEWLWVV